MQFIFVLAIYFYKFRQFFPEYLFFYLLFYLVALILIYVNYTNVFKINYQVMYNKKCIKLVLISLSFDKKY